MLPLAMKRRQAWCWRGVSSSGATSQSAALRDGSPPLQDTGLSKAHLLQIDSPRPWPWPRKDQHSRWGGPEPVPAGAPIWPEPCDSVPAPISSSTPALASLCSWRRSKSESIYWKTRPGESAIRGSMHNGALDMQFTTGEETN